MKKIFTLLLLLYSVQLFSQTIYYVKPTGNDANDGLSWATAFRTMNGTGDGNIDPDWIIIDDHHLQLRAERSGRGSGRTYTVTVTATDAAGNKASAAATVIVPHDKADLTTAHRSIAPGEEINGLQLQAFPNPSTDGFNISIKSSSMQPINIEVVDHLGRTIESRRGLPANGNVYLGSSYRPGIYVVQVTQANTVQNCKVVKQGH
jgi:hypothetical protein